MEGLILEIGCLGVFRSDFYSNLIFRHSVSSLFMFSGKRLEKGLIVSF